MSVRTARWRLDLAAGRREDIPSGTERRAAFTVAVAALLHTLSPTQLFRGLMMSSAGMTKRLDRLEQQGLVKRNPDKNDRRGVTIHLTVRGRWILARAVAENTKSEATLLAGLSAKERRVLADLLREVLSRLEPAAGG